MSITDNLDPEDTQGDSLGRPPRSPAARTVSRRLELWVTVLALPLAALALLLAEPQLNRR
jgi:hypothetical protein